MSVKQFGHINLILFIHSEGESFDESIYSLMFFSDMLLEVRRSVKLFRTLRTLKRFDLVMAIDVVFELSFRRKRVIAKLTLVVLETFMSIDMD